MVTKRCRIDYSRQWGLILAKIYMVTKQEERISLVTICLILAKIYMVTKRSRSF